MKKVFVAESGIQQTEVRIQELGEKTWSQSMFITREEKSSYFRVSCSEGGGAVFPGVVRSRFLSLSSKSNSDFLVEWRAFRGYLW